MFQNITENITSMQCADFMPSFPAVIIFSIILILIAATATIFNALIITAVVLDPLKRLHTPFNFLLVNLAVADFIQGAVPVPLVAYHLIKHEKGIRLTSLLVHCLTCISLVSVSISTLSLAYDRYLAITRPIKYRFELSWSRCLKISLVVWLMSIPAGFLVIYSGHNLEAFLVYNYSMFIAGIIVMVAVYVRVHLFLKNHEKEFRDKFEECFTVNTEASASRYSLEKRITRVLLVVLAVFLLTYVPALAMLNVTQHCLQCSCHLRFNVYVIRYVLLVSNSAWNPFIYTMHMKSYRMSIELLFTILMGKLQKTRRYKRNILGGPPF